MPPFLHFWRGLTPTDFRALTVADYRAMDDYRIAALKAQETSNG